MESVREIPLDRALALCRQASTANAQRRWDPRSWQCWGCLKFSGPPEKRCFAAKPGNRGCPFVNALADVDPLSDSHLPLT